MTGKGSWRPNCGEIRLRVLIGVLAIVAAVLGAFSAYAWHSPLAPIDLPRPASFAPDQVRRGETLAAIGNCAACHTTPNGPAFSGSLPVPTPFGAVYASNLTPDPDTGIGRWSEEAFRRAMREGIDREGRQLYPAFPYDHYTRVTDEDDRALYAYLMTRTPAARRTPPPALMFPLGFRPIVAGWKLLFFRSGPRPAAGSDDPVIVRGAYLVEGLGHCGACHTPRNVLGAERSDALLAGGLAEGWNAYALNAASPAPVPWTPDTLAFYLKHGWQSAHGVARGPMAAVTAGLAAAPEDDVAAMAAYLVRGMQGGADRPPRPEATLAPLHAASAGSQAAVPAVAGDEERGAAIYAGACASCHDSGRSLPFGGLALELSSALHAPDPTNIVLVTLRGLRPPPGAAGPIMPGLDGTLDDDGIVALLAYLRASIAREAPWPDLPATVRKARERSTTPLSGDAPAPAATSIRAGP